MTPTSTLSSATQAIETQKCGAPRAKFAVPSIGSTTHTAPPAPAGRALALLADEPVGGKDPEEALGDERLGLAVDLGQIVLRALEPDGERAIEKPAPRHCARLARDRLRREQSHVHERRRGFSHSDGLQKWL